MTTTRKDGQPQVVRRKPEATTVELVPGAYFPGNGVTVRWRAHPSGLRVEVDVLPLRGKLVAVDVRASSDDGVTLDALRKIAIRPFIHLAAHDMFIKLAIRDEPYSRDQARRRQKAGETFWGALNVLDRDRLRDAGPTAETLQWVALLYRLADAIGEPPAKSIADGFAVSARTATNWVKAARDAGYLTGDDHGVDQ